MTTIGYFEDLRAKSIAIFSLSKIPKRGVGIFVLYMNFFAAALLEVILAASATGAKIMSPASLNLSAIPAKIDFSEQATVRSILFILAKSTKPSMSSAFISIQFAKSEIA